VAGFTVVGGSSGGQTDLLELRAWLSNDAWWLTAFGPLILSFGVKYIRFYVSSVVQADVGIQHIADSGVDAIPLLSELFVSGVVGFGSHAPS
jgi:hypothetical protein